MEEILKASVSTGDVKYKTVCNSRSHSLFADEPIEKNGGNLGPTPTELLCMSLAACTSITLKMYSQRKQWDLGEIYVNVTLERLADKSIFKKEIRFEKDPGEEAVKRLLVIADKCPVHKILHSQNEFITESLKEE